MRERKKERKRREKEREKMNFSREKNRENRNSFEHFERIIVFAIKIFNINPAKMEEIFFPRAEEGRRTDKFLESHFS